MGNELGRTGKSIRRKLEELGLSSRCEEGYSAAELARRLHVRRERVREWLDAGLIKRSRNRLISDRSLAPFFRDHSDQLNWDVVEQHVEAWILELGGKRPEPEISRCAER
jgi:hypothetical protein